LTVLFFSFFKKINNIKNKFMTEQQAGEGANNTTTPADDMPIMVKKCLELWKSGGEWQLTKERDGVTYRTKQVPWCKTLALWLTTTIPKVRATDVEGILCDDPDGSNKNSHAFKFDKMLDKRMKISELQTEPYLLHIWRS
jgi:hypothetical protein